MIEELERLEKEATPAPWRWMNRRCIVGDHGRRPVVLISDSRMEVRDKASGLLVENTLNYPDPTLIIQLRNAAPALLKVVRAAENIRSKTIPFPDGQFVMQQRMDYLDEALKELEELGQ